MINLDLMVHKVLEAKELGKVDIIHIAQMDLMALVVLEISEIYLVHFSLDLVALLVETLIMVQKEAEI